MGSGHLMRCLTLANRLRDGGAAVSFISRELPGNMVEFTVSQGFPVHKLPGPGKIREASGSPVQHAQWLGVDWQIDAEETAVILARECGILDWLVVDHYALDREWETRLRPYVRKIMVIDDLADRRHDCDLLLDQNLFENQESRYNGLVPPHCQKLLGPRYALLRPEFLSARQTLRVRDGSIKRILIFFGGGDPSNETAKALEAVEQLNRPDIAVDVVVGGANPYKEQIQGVCAGLTNAAWHCQITNMAQLMAAADLAIGGGGTTTWERSCLELPCLITAIAFNQEAIAENLHRAGAAIYLGPSQRVSESQISCWLRELLGNPDYVRNMGRTASELVNGQGCYRVVNYITEFSE